MTEKFCWGYEDQTPNQEEAFRLYKQAADLGVSDAWIRVAELYEHGKGVERNFRKALEAYIRAVRAGNYYAFAFAARLISRGPALEKANQLWDKFFHALSARPDAEFKAASRGELLHMYIKTQLSKGLEPEHLTTLRLYRIEIAGHHQRVLERVRPEDLDSLDGPFEWIAANLGPWPIANVE